MNKLSRAGVFSLMLAASLTIMVGSAITPALIQISEHYGVEDMATWLTTLPALGVVLFAPIAGRLIDRVGSYIALFSGLILYGAIGVSAIWLSGTIPIFADRILLGGATAIVMSSSTGLLAEFFVGEERLKMIALQGMSIEAGGIIFLSIGGVLGGLGWQWPFMIYLIAWVALLFLIIFVPFRKSSNLEEEQESNTANATSILSVLLAALLAMTMFFIAFITLPFYLAENFGLGSASTGYFLAMISLVAVISASVMPKMVKRFSDYQTLLAGFSLFTIGFIILTVGQSLFALAILAGIVIGFGFGFTIPLANHMVVEKSNVSNRGKNLAYFSSFTFLGQFLSSFVEGISSNLVVIYLIAVIFGLLIIIFYSLWLKRNKKRQILQVQ
ncbi:MFS transporter [Guptibacillus hwajinpoensis]|uniref:MFS transporter n=1 Tax=Guptibacillus hwajinpoensis TaxID=208199 RepID=UPI001883377A|nr:MFS transporter [Pseudalkalibacillus hwajinpoensis]MBF0707468.1 MFS transporter [Pseudalkalibacillus hwajinpoensis]WLR58880.1 MFS transporter [Pseudalkalibacillus hwajinpoensis]